MIFTEWKVFIHLLNELNYRQIPAKNVYSRDIVAMDKFDSKIE